MSKKAELKLPYNVDFEIFDKILGELQHTKEDGINVNTMWINTGEAKNVNKSYSLNMAKFLGLIEIVGDNVKLTKTGRLVTLTSEGKRNEMLVRNLPDKYIAMYKWIKLSPNHQMQSGDLKVKYHETYGDIHSQNLLERSIATFMKYMEHISVATHSGKGKGAKVILTDAGKTILDSIPTHFTDNKENTDAHDIKSHKLAFKEQSPLEDGSHIITIISPGRQDFAYEIRAKTDWDVIDKVIESMKRDWETKNKPTEEGNSECVGD
jgi:hypothetical protein